MESWLDEFCGRKVNFDIGKALHKLSAIAAPGELVSQAGGKWTAKPLAEARALMDDNWDKIFDYGQSSA